MVPYLRDFTDLPFGVHPNRGYRTRDGWNADDEFADLALRSREEGAELIGGCCGVGPDEIAAARGRLEGTARGRGAQRAVDHDAVEPAEPWSDVAGRSLYPLAFPDLIGHGGVFVPSQGSFLVWRHLFNEHVGMGLRCLDVGCGSGLQTIQLALNGAEHVHGIDIDAHHLDVSGSEVIVAYLLEITHGLSAAPRE